MHIASVALILAVIVQMSRETLLDWRTVLITLISLAVVFFFKKLNTAFVTLGEALLGYILTLF